MTSPTPQSPADRAVPTEWRAKPFDPAQAPEHWRNDRARLAIESPGTRVVFATPAALALFGAKDIEALEGRLVGGEGPSARRLRHLAATLRIGEPPRLERMRFFVDRREAAVNLSCARFGELAGASWLLVSAPALGPAEPEPDREPESEPEPSAAPASIRAEDMQPDDPAPPLPGEPPPPKSRFLWTLDEKGRFGAAHPVLLAAVGAGAPRRGETLEFLLSRVQITRGDELASVVAARETFADALVEWPAARAGRVRHIALSAAPLFGPHREFMGYRGYGLLGEEIESQRPSRDDGAPGASAERAEAALAGVADETTAALEAASDDDLEASNATPSETPAWQDEAMLATPTPDIQLVEEDRPAPADGEAPPAPPETSREAAANESGPALFDASADGYETESGMALPEVFAEPDGNELAPAIPETGGIGDSETRQAPAPGESSAEPYRSEPASAPPETSAGSMPPSSSRPGRRRRSSTKLGTGRALRRSARLQRNLRLPSRPLRRLRVPLKALWASMGRSRAGRLSEPSPGRRRRCCSRLPSNPWRASRIRRSSQRNSKRSNCPPRRPAPPPMIGRARNQPLRR